MNNIVLSSGGLDSTTLLYWLQEKRQGKITPLFFSYGQKSKEKERFSVRRITKILGLNLVERDISDVFISSNSLLLAHNRKSITTEFWHGLERRIENRNTEVEFRNGVFLSAAISFAMQISAEERCIVFYGAIFTPKIRDCTKTFVQKLDDLAKYVSQGRIRVAAPFVDKGKDEILEIAREQKVPIDLTWSCYLGNEEPCRKCPACFDKMLLGVLK